MNLRTVELDHTDHAALDLWWGAASRGFLSKPETDVAVRAERRQLLVGSSILGVYDDTAAEPLVPVGTLGSFPTALSIPGGTVRALAITEVTVSTSHERRGIARSLMENRLHHATPRSMSPVPRERSNSPGATVASERGSSVWTRPAGGAPRQATRLGSTSCVNSQVAGAKP